MPLHIEEKDGYVIAHFESDPGSRVILRDNGTMAFNREPLHKETLGQELYQAALEATSSRKRRQFSPEEIERYLSLQNEINLMRLRGSDRLDISKPPRNRPTALISIAKPSIYIGEVSSVRQSTERSRVADVYYKTAITIYSGHKSPGEYGIVDIVRGLPDGADHVRVTGMGRGTWNYQLYDLGQPKYQQIVEEAISLARDRT